MYFKPGLPQELQLHHQLFPPLWESLLSAGYSLGWMEAGRVASAWCHTQPSGRHFQHLCFTVKKCQSLQLAETSVVKKNPSLSMFCLLMNCKGLVLVMPVGCNVSSLFLSD